MALGEVFDEELVSGGAEVAAMHCTGMDKGKGLARVWDVGEEYGEVGREDSVFLQEGVHRDVGDGFREITRGDGNWGVSAG